MKISLSLCKVMLIISVCLSPTLTIAHDDATPGINGTVTFFYYDDIESATGFYGELLHLPLTMDEEWVKIYQITPNSSVGLVQQGKGFHDVAEDKPAMLSMVTEDVDGWYARLNAASAVILKELPPATDTAAKDATAVRGFVAQDPGGYTIEFFSWPK